MIDQAYLAVLYNVLPENAINLHLAFKRVPHRNDWQAILDLNQRHIGNRLLHGRG